VAWLLLTTSWAYLRHQRFARAGVLTVARGLRDGVRPVPRTG